MPTTPVTLPGDVVDLVRQAHSITVFSGAGMSAESGVPTFRDAQTGLWERYDPAALATVDAWDNDPALVWGWYLWRMKLVGDAQPNPGHRAITALADHRTVMVVTQNVDDLHERAGSNVISHLHGSLNLDELAAQFKLSRFHFAKTYRALTGHAPIQDFIQLKMAQACRLLDQGSLEVRQIAEQLGYDDPYYFSRLFRKVVGMAPSHYRALHRG